MNDKLTLSELQLIIKDSLYLAFPDMYWVIAEISEIKENYNGHCYLELVEKIPGETNISARIKAVIWSSRFRFIKSFFENSTGESLGEGLKILVKIRIEYHEIYGLSLVINDIDPSFTIGEMALRRQQILQKLTEEGIITMNRDLEFPLVPQRIAVISSFTAAGYSDFMKHLTGNSYGYVFYTALFEAPMQGKETETGLLKAMDKIASVIENFDLAVIIRGGGSQTDLSWFDNYNIGYYITQFPIPVITGIGHEKDLTVADIVAHRSLKTPTAVADFLVESMSNTENQLLDISREIAEQAMILIEESKKQLEDHRMKIIPLAKIMLSEFREILSETLIGMINTGKDFLLRTRIVTGNHETRVVSASRTLIAAKRTAIMHEKELIERNLRNNIVSYDRKLNVLGDSLKMLDPVNVLKRGYTLTSLNGRIIKQRAGIANGDIINTRFSDGSVNSKVLD